MKRVKYFLLLLFAAVSLGANAQTDFFGIPKVEIGGRSYQLAWSAKIKFRYIEDFLPKNTSNADFSSKVSLDFFKADVEVEKVVNAKMAELKVSKAENRLTNLTRTVAPNGDILLEYVAYVPGGKKMYVAEWNLCRCAANSKGVIILQMKHRDYDVELEKFLSQVDKKRAGWIKEVNAYQIPNIVVKEQ